MSVLLNSLIDLQNFAQQFAMDSYDDEGGGGWLLLAGPVVGGATWWGLYNFYRNVDKSHAFEKETLIESQPITGSDNKIDTVKGTQRTEIKGNNRDKHRTRVTRL